MVKISVAKMGAVALALALSGVPVLAAHAEGVEGGMNVGASAGGMQADASTTMQVTMPGEEGSESNGERGQEGMGASGGTDASSSMQEQSGAMTQQAEQMREAAKQQLENMRESYKNALELGLMASATPAFSVEELQQAIEQKKQELEQMASSTATSSRGLFEHASPVALAVHALLASRDLLGSTTIGARVSVVAQEMNDSLASSTEAEARIEARGFWQKLFFGGDTKAAETLSQTAAQNQARIDELTNLLGEASTTADVKATLSAQIDALKTTQASLQAEAKAQQNLWGIFSWRLF